jgi:hypothetical protein
MGLIHWYLPILLESIRDGPLWHVLVEQEPQQVSLLPLCPVCNPLSTCSRLVHFSHVTGPFELVKLSAQLATLMAKETARSKAIDPRTINHAKVLSDVYNQKLASQSKSVLKSASKAVGLDLQKEGKKPLPLPDYRKKGVIRGAVTIAKYRGILGQ